MRLRGALDQSTAVPFVHTADSPQPILYRQLRCEKCHTRARGPSNGDTLNDARGAALLRPGASTAKALGVRIARERAPGPAGLLGRSRSGAARPHIIERLRARRAAPRGEPATGSARGAHATC